MTTDLIIVNRKPFFGRVEEQKQFRTALSETLHPPHGETLPYVILLYGDGGIGKTTLASRFRDIASEELPFKGKVLTLWVNWEAERNCLSALQVGREYIHPETVFDVIYTTAAARAGWEHFETYRQTCDERKQAEKQALQALQSSGERDDLTALRGLGAETLTALVRRALPIGEQGEKLIKAFLEAGIQLGAERAYALRRSIETRLKTRLGVRQFDLYLNPHEALARALADGFKRLSNRHALLVVLDTYEIVDRADPWLRLVLQNAGPRLVWVISGRDNLRDSRWYGAGYFRGYSEDFPRRLLAYDLAQLALQDVRAYFAAAVPERPLDEEAAHAIRRATHGIPLAVTEAAEMWQKGVSLEEIVTDADEATPSKEIVRKMTDRYLLHAVRPEERRALYALALARGDLEVLRALLAPADGSPFDLEAELRRLERDYASVVAFEGRLHDEPQDFFLAYLREPLQRQSDAVRDLLTRAEAALRDRLARLEAELPLIEERHADEDWRKTVLDLTDILFWQAEERAWPFLLARFVESLAYSAELRRGLLATAARWEKALSARGKRRLQALRIAEDGWPSVEEEGTLLSELRRAADLGWLTGEGEAERRAVLAWREGKWLFRQKRYPEALASYEAAERGLPPGGETLREHLAEAFEEIGEKLGWLRDDWRTIDAVASPEAEYAYQKAADLGRSSSSLYHSLGAVQSKLGKHELSLQNRKKALEIDPENVFAWNGLGNVYRDLGRHEEAIAAYQKAIELYGRVGDSPHAAYPWNGLGIVYSDLGRHDDAIAAYQQAIALDPKYAYPWHGLGNVYYTLGRHEEAIEAYQQAIELDPNSASAGVAWNNLAGVYLKQKRFEEARHALQERIRLRPDNTFAPLISLGVLTRHLGESESNTHFQNALAQWDKAWRDRLQSPASLLENKAIALLCRGRKEEALQTLREALAQRLPGDVIDFTDYELLRAAPHPPEGLEEMLALLNAAQAH
ncbi:MAG: hypothetical protein Fur0018_25680 [Anaerolineales bacterium]